MKAAKPVEVDNKAQQNKNQKQKDPVVVPHAEVEVDTIQTQKSENPFVNPGSANPGNNRLGLNGTTAAIHGSQTIYDQGSKVSYGRFKENLQQTGDINHPETKNLEKNYMSTLNINQIEDYNNLKSGNYAPKTVQEQAEAYQESKKVQEGKAANPETDKPESNAEEKSPEEIKYKAEEQSVEAAPSPNAQNNPEFNQLSGKITETAQSQKSHEPAQKASNAAQAAAPSPANERESMAQAGKVDHMDAQKPGTFSKEEFKVLLKQKIEGIRLPKDEAEADDFENNNNIQQVNKNAVADVKNEKNAATNDIASATAAKPNVAAQPVRAVAKMPTPNTGKAPGVPNAAKAMPNKRDSASVEKPLQEETNTIDSEMKAHGVTDQMLAKSNEPSFTEALDEKNKAKTESAAATEKFRKTENTELSKTREQAQSQAINHIAGMHNARKGGLNHAHGEQKNTATKDSQKRKEIADRINSIYNSSKTDVDTILNNLDKTVASRFDAGSKEAKKAFEEHVDKKMKAYKEKRYGGSWLSWKNIKRVGDAIVGLPKEVNAFFVSGKQEYIKTMDRYIDEIAGHVTTQLNAAKARIAKGKKEVQTYVNSLSPSLRKIGKEAIADIQSKFNALEESVNSKKDALIDVLAKKYADNIAGIDARIEELKAQNSGLVSKALNALSGVFAVIIEIKNTLTNLLSGIADVVMAIIADPIGFFKNLIAGVGQGFANFGANIWTHLKTGFFTWLTGATKGIDLTMPEDIFSLKGIFSITTQVLGLTWNGIRAIGSRVIGEPVMKVLETSFEMVQIVRKEGVAGLWEHLKDQFADLKATIMDTIMDMIQTQVIQAGIKWVMGLLTPVGAFIKAAMAIIDVVKFFIQRAAQIMELIKAFIDSVAAIASGNVGAVAKSIENALGKAVPVLIGFLASLLGIGGLADKVLGVIRKIRQRIENAIVKFWTFVKGKAGKLLSKIGVGGKEKEDKSDKKKGKEETSEGDFNEKEKFETPRGDKHTLYFEDKGGKDVLMMRSTPRTYEEYINTVEVDSTNPKKVATKKELLNLVVQMKALDNKDEKYEIKMSKIFNEIFTLTKELFQVGQSSVPIFRGTTEGGFGDSMTIEYLSKIPHSGTKGSDTGGLTTSVYSSIDKRHLFYVRGHLLSEKLHGPGIWENLTPLTRSANSNHESDIEKTLKEGVEKNIVYHYHVKAVYGRKVNSSLLSKLENSDKLELEKDVLREIILNEQHVPLKLTAHAVEIDEETGAAKGKNVHLETIINDLKDYDLANYQLTETKKPELPINLNTATLEDLKFIFSETIAIEIFNLRKKNDTFDSINDLLSIKYLTKDKLLKLLNSTPKPKISL